MTSSQQLSKSERINSKKLIDRLFKGGGAKSMSAFPLRVVFMTEDADAHEPLAKMMVRWCCGEMVRFDVEVLL
jgi:ribonuclease P protein component